MESGKSPAALCMFLYSLSALHPSIQMHKYNQSKTRHNDLSSLLRNERSGFQRSLKLSNENVFLIFTLSFLQSCPSISLCGHTVQFLSESCSCKHIDLHAYPPKPCECLFKQKLLMNRASYTQKNNENIFSYRVLRKIDKKHIHLIMYVCAL